MAISGQLSMLRFFELQTWWPYIQLGAQELTLGNYTCNRIYPVPASPEKVKNKVKVPNSKRDSFQIWEIFHQQCEIKVSGLSNSSQQCRADGSTHTWGYFLWKSTPIWHPGRIRLEGIKQATWEKDLDTPARELKALSPWTQNSARSLWILDFGNMFLLSNSPRGMCAEM